MCKFSESRREVFMYLKCVILCNGAEQKLEKFVDVKFCNFKFPNIFYDYSIFLTVLYSSVGFISHLNSVDSLKIFK